MLLEIRHILNNAKNKSIVISRLLKQTDNYKHVFSDMKESSKIFLNILSKMQHKKYRKRKKSVLKHNKFDKNLDNTIQRGGRTCGFCSMIGCTTPGCATKMNIGRIIKGDDLIVLLKDKYAFKQMEKSG